MRILFTLHNFFPEPMYGAERICLLQMKHFMQAGHTVGLFYAGNEDIKPEVLEKEGLGGIHLYRVSYLKTKAQILLSVWKPHVAAGFRRTIKRFQPDAVIFHHLVRLSLNLPAIARGKNIPTVYYLHDYYPICPSYSLFDSSNTICRQHSTEKCIRCLFKTRFKSAIPGILIPLILPVMNMRKRLIDRLAPDLFMSPSKSLLAEMKRQGFRMPKTLVAPHGICKAGNAHPYRPHAPVRFGFIGNMNIKKGINVLVSAFQGELSKMLTIRGFTNQSAINKFKSGNPGFGAKLEPFSTDLGSFYEHIDILVAPSLWLENQPTVILEAFSYGKPVLCSRLGGLEELVKPGAGGLLFSPGNSSELRRHAERLAANPAELSALAANIPKIPGQEAYTESVMTAVEALVNH